VEDQTTFNCVEANKQRQDWCSPNGLLVVKENASEGSRDLSINVNQGKRVGCGGSKKASQSGPICAVAISHDGQSRYESPLRSNRDPASLSKSLESDVPPAKTLTESACLILKDYDIEATP